MSERRIACTLDASEVPDRLEVMRALGSEALESAGLDGPRASLRFTAGEGVAKRVRAPVAAEQECCGWLTHSVAERDGVVLLAVEGPEGSEPAVAEWVSAFSGG